MEWKIALFFFVTLGSVLAQEAVLYDAYFGKPISEKRSGYLAGVANGTTVCTVPVLPCRKEEGRRVDGTCTNPKHPSRGASMTPLPRLLPAQYGPARYFPLSDCCVGNTPNRVNPSCIPIPVPGDDPYLRIPQIRCLNLTRIINYQDLGCLPNSLSAERYSVVTPLLDLSLVYGNTEARNRMIRSNQGGELAFRMEGDREVPQGQSVNCLNNQPLQGEVVCYNFGDAFQANLLPGIYLTTMWFFREHNRIARGLAKVNPCWDDEKLFQTARQINIAQYQYIFYYELIVELLGRKNALAEGIVYETAGYVNDFDPHYEPGVIREYILGARWFHNFQAGQFDLYRNGKYRGRRPAPDDSLRSGILSVNNTEADLTQGSLIQPSDDFDYVIAPDLAERYFGEVQTANDLPATDMMRGRDAGLPPYNHYRKICGMKPAKHWEDFHDAIDKDVSSHVESSQSMTYKKEVE
nr:peroxidase-like [Helicoverpa armigera]